MATDNETWQNASATEGNANASRDGGNQYKEGFGRPQRPYDNGGERPYRPRFNSGDRPQRAYSSDRPYRPRFNPNQEGGEGQQRSYRPRFNPSREGDGQQRSYRPRFNPNQEGGEGYQQRSYRPRFNPNQEGGEGQQRPYRPRFNPNQEGGYGQQQQRGYRPRFNPNQEGGEGQQRSFRPRFNPNNGGRRPGYAGGGNNGGYGQQQRPYRQRTADYNPNAKYSKKKQIEYKEQFVDPNEPIRLNKFLANAGICSRREADEFIQAGVVSVNGQVVTELGTKIKRSDEVKFHDQPVSIERKIYILLNKPKDTVTTSDDPQARRTVMDLVKNACPERIYPVGRLDRNTTGVLLLTNDGDLASKLTHPKYLKKKIYHVHLDKDLTRADMDQIVQGIQLDDGEIHADAISYTNEEKKNDVGIEIHSGRNRIVRRIFESLGYKVVKLDRVYFAGLTKKGLRRGEWRFLTEAEVNYLRMGAFE